MEFKNEELIEREIEIACCLMQDYSLKMIAARTGLSKIILVAHLRNMMKKLQAADLNELVTLIKKTKI